MAQSVQISKSQFLKGRQCPLSLWYALYRRDLRPEPDPSREGLFASGREVGEWAKKCFPDGVEIKASFYDHTAGAAETQALIAAGHQAVFEATAVHPADGSHARADILQKVPGTNGWDIIEVKGATEVEEYHLDDLAFQYRVFTAAGYRIRKCVLMHINNQYMRRGDIDPQALFTMDDLTDQVTAKQQETEQSVMQLRQLSAWQEPKIRSFSADC